ncbi:MAG: hypothetical protein KC731_28460 [Myxococcales bacterium]|nr:hypothetical protein [Myxococcales bacterium]
MPNLVEGPRLAVDGYVDTDDDFNRLHIFSPADLLASVTLSVDGRPLDNLSLCEHRPARATVDIFFGGVVAGDGGTPPFATSFGAEVLP